MDTLKKEIHEIKAERMQKEKKERNYWAIIVPAAFITAPLLIGILF